MLVNRHRVFAQASLTLLRCCQPAWKDSQLGEVLFKASRVSWRGKATSRRPGPNPTGSAASAPTSAGVPQFNLWAHMTILQRDGAPLTVLARDRTEKWRRPARAYLDKGRIGE